MLGVAGFDTSLRGYVSVEFSKIDFFLYPLVSKKHNLIDRIVQKKLFHCPICSSNFD